PRGVDDVGDRVAEPHALRVFVGCDVPGRDVAPAGSDDQHLVPGGDEAFHQPVAHPLDAAIAGRGKLEPWGSDDGDPEGMARGPGSAWKQCGSFLSGWWGDPAPPVRAPASATPGWCPSVCPCGGGVRLCSDQN